MAKYDQGGGCACGLYKECEPNCIYSKPYTDEEMRIIKNQLIKKIEEKMNLNEDDDFGFTFADSNEIKAKVETTENKLEGLRNMIMPLLNNLMKDPEKDTILWPDREKKIKAFIKKMDAYINS